MTIAADRDVEQNLPKKQTPDLGLKQVQAENWSWPGSKVSASRKPVLGWVQSKWKQKADLDLGPKQVQAESWSRSGFELFDTLIVFLKEFLKKKVYFE